MVSWGEAKGPQSPDRKQVERLKIEGSKTIRLIGDVLPRYVYWITTAEGKKMPVECLEFQRDNETFDPKADNPFNEIPDEVYGSGQNEKAQFAYVCNVIDRDDGQVKLFDLKRTIYTQIVGFAQNPEWGNPADEEKGYDITITKEKTGPLPQNVKYTCTPGRNSTPITKEEKELELFDLNAMLKRPTYEEQKSWLMDNTTYFSGLSDEAFSPGETAEDLT